VIYVRAIVELLRSDVPVLGLAHITGGGVTNLLRLGGERLGWEIAAPLPVPPVFDLIAARGAVPPEEMWEVFNMGCGFVAVVPEERAGDAVALLGARHPGAARIGTVTDAGGTVSVAPLGLRYTRT
jgi:phosphoribosylformylglycinamidine cyclo-ligase